MKKFLRNSNPEVSIIIVNYNTGSLLSECVASVKKSVNVEIIIVDNRSTDEGVTGIKGIAGTTSINKFVSGEIKIIRNEKNIGFARAVNQGIKEAHGKYILLLNPDTKVRPGTIESMVEFAKRTSDAGVIGAQLVNPDGSAQPSVFHFPTLLGAISEFWLGREGAYSKYMPGAEGPTEVDVVVGAAFLITPVAIRKVGLFDERFFMYFEDLDYCRRVWQKGLKVYYLPTAEVIHYHGVSGRGQQAIQLQRLQASSKKYHGIISHYLINFVLWVGQKWQKIQQYLFF